MPTASASIRSETAVYIRAAPNMDISHNIVVCPNVMESDGRIYSEVDLDEVRNHLVYWDRIIVVSHSEAEVRRDPHLDYLIEGGLLSLERVKLDFSLSNGISTEFAGPEDLKFRLSQAELVYNAILVKSLRMRANKHSEFVAYSEPSWGLQIPIKIQKTSPIMQIDLNHLLPRPSADIPFENIIEFREKRRDQLNALRTSMLQLLQQAEADPWVLRGKFIAGKKLKDALEEWNAVASETRIMRASKESMRITTTLRNAMAFTGAAALLNSGDPAHFRIPIGVAAIGGVVATFVDAYCFEGRSAGRLPSEAVGFKYEYEVKKLLT